jgi:hypothetical protein
VSFFPKKTLEVISNPLNEMGTILFKYVSKAGIKIVPEKLSKFVTAFVFICSFDFAAC